MGKRKRTPRSSVDAPVHPSKKQKTTLDVEGTEISDYAENEDVDEVENEENEIIADTKDQTASNEAIPGWMAHGQILEDWKQVPVDNLRIWLKDSLRKRLVDFLPTEEGTQTHLFPVQAAVLPAVVRGAQIVQDLCPLYSDQEVEKMPQKRERTALGAGDLLVCAPTGSGKTIAFVLPLIQALENRIIPQTRAVILLPSRDLALQVYNVFVSLLAEHQKQRTVDSNLALRVAQCLGKSSFEEEQRHLVHPYVVDIIIATPGRLIDHLNANFSLRHLQYLIVDEADRLLMQSYQDWPARILKAARQENNVTDITNANTTINHYSHSTSNNVNDESDMFAPQTEIQPIIPQIAPMRKYLFSATLTRNPAKIANLHLQNPLFFQSSATSRFKLPDTIKELIISCRNSVEKPLVLVQLLRMPGLTQTLCFTKSVEATHRLFILLRLFEFKDIAEFSSTLSQKDRTKIIKQFRNGKIKLLICSDAMSRGMDIDHVGSVINYDSPKYVKAYIHRAGRTGRAGKEGTCYTILTDGGVVKYRRMRKKADDPERVQPLTINREELEATMDLYQEKLQTLKSILDEEKQLLANAANNANNYSGSKQPQSDKQHADKSESSAAVATEA